jgi:predicted class III extradiol MEMO1 family dioxygenase
MGTIAAASMNMKTELVYYAQSNAVTDRSDMSVSYVSMVTYPE